jgi:hypothetical protein
VYAPFGFWSPGTEGTWLHCGGEGRKLLESDITDEGLKITVGMDPATRDQRKIALSVSGRFALWAVSDDCALQTPRPHSLDVARTCVR